MTLEKQVTLALRALVAIEVHSEIKKFSKKQNDMNKI